MIVVERCRDVPPRIKRGTPGPDGLVYGSRRVCKSSKGDFLVYHKWVSFDVYRSSLKRIGPWRPTQRRTRDAQNVMGLHNIQGRARDAASSLRRVDRRPRWYALEWLGCPLDEFRSRFNGLFRDGMSWDAPHTWHMDHVVPLSVFDWTNPLSPYVCGHWSNYQPLSPAENSRKHMRLDMEAIEMVARRLPKPLLPVVRDIASLLGKTEVPSILCPEGPELSRSVVQPTISIMYSIRPISSEDRSLLISPPPCPTHTEHQSFCCTLG